MRKFWEHTILKMSKHFRISYSSYSLQICVNFYILILLIVLETYCDLDLCLICKVFRIKWII